MVEQREDSDLDYKTNLRGQKEKFGFQTSKTLRRSGKAESHHSKVLIQGSRIYTDQLFRENAYVRKVLDRHDAQIAAATPTMEEEQENLAAQKKTKNKRLNRNKNSETDDEEEYERGPSRYHIGTNTLDQLLQHTTPHEEKMIMRAAKVQCVKGNKIHHRIDQRDQNSSSYKYKFQEHRHREEQKT